MLVLLDLEWVGYYTEKQLTQLSAIRVDNDWTILSRFDALVCPGPDGIQDAAHIAYGGYAPETFAQGINTATCIRRFSAWLEDGDRIWTWANSNRQYFKSLWQTFLPDPVPSVRSRVDKACVIASSKGIKAFHPYQMLEEVGIATPAPEHRSSNDVEVMRLLFEYLDIVNWKPEKPKPLTPSQIREKNAEIVGRTQYNYLYVPGSDVFHRRDCKLVLGAKTILGSRSFATAAMRHRPCKVCHPVGGLDLAPAIEPPAPRTSNYKPLPPADNELVNARTVDGNSILIRKNNILGWCHYDLHRGAVTKSIFEQHDCARKGCHYFERNDSSTYWAIQKLKAEEKAKARLQKQEQKLAAAALAEHLHYTQAEWQSILNDLGSDMQIVRLEKTAAAHYTIYYVSDNPFADGNRYPDFLSALATRHPMISIRLRHIKDIDGHFVTRAEYKARVPRSANPSTL